MPISNVRKLNRKNRRLGRGAALVVIVGTDHLEGFADEVIDRPRIAIWAGKWIKYQLAGHFDDLVGKRCCHSSNFRPRQIRSESAAMRQLSQLAFRKLAMPAVAC